MISQKRGEIIQVMASVGKNCIILAPWTLMTMLAGTADSW